MGTTHIEGWKVYGVKLNKMDDVTFEAYIGMLQMDGVYKSYDESKKRVHYFCFNVTNVMANPYDKEWQTEDKVEKSVLYEYFGKGE